MIKIVTATIFMILFCVAQVYMIQLYFHAFIEKKGRNIKFLIISCVLMVIIKLLPSDTGVLVKTFAFIFIISVIVFASFGGTTAQKVYHIIFFSLIMVLSDLCLSFLVYRLSKIFTVYEGTVMMTIIYFVFNCLSLLLSFVVIKLLIHFKVDADIDLNNREYCLLGIVPFCSLLCILGIDILNKLSIFEYYLFLLIVNVCIMLIYYKFLRKNIAEQKYILIKSENEYYQSCLSAQKELMQFKHDLKNILINLDFFLAENQNEDARHQLSKLIDIGNESYERYSGCATIDAILTNKLAVCDQKHINSKIDVQFPHDINIDSIDIPAILGNLLDNGIEATLRLDDLNKRMVSIVIKYADDKLVIKIANTCRMTKVDFSMHMLSSDKEKGRYGIGINSVRDRIDKLGGYYDFSCKDELFQVLVVIPLSY